MPLKLSERIQAALPPQLTAGYAALAREYVFEEKIANSLVVREAAGVAACITPWNYPLHQIMAKVAPALAAGCTVVLKPSELAPLTAYVLAEVIHDAELPGGVFNLVCGTGPVVGEGDGCTSRHRRRFVHGFDERRQARLLACRADSEAGRAGAGRKIRYRSAGRCRLPARRARRGEFLLSEFGADMHGAHAVARARGTLRRGRRAGRRSGVRVYARRSAGQRDPAGSARLGEAARPRARYINKGIEEGAELLLGGAQPPDGLVRGYYVAPTVFGQVQPNMTIAQEEIFGPVLSILTYRDEEEAIDIANGTPYGLAAAVWSGSDARALELARRLRAGRVEVNGGPFNLLAPFGGYKQSGHGREFGRYGLEEFLEVKSLQLTS